MNASLPPWLNVGPTDFLHSAEAGTAAGQRNRQMSDEMAKFQQEMGMKQQAMAADEQDRQQRVASAEQHLQLETQRAEVEKQQAEMRMEQETTAASHKLQAKGTYDRVFAELTGSGLDPGTAAIRATLAAGPTELGETGAGAVAMMRASAPFTPKVQDFGDGVRGFQTGPQSWAQVPSGTGAEWRSSTKTIDGNEIPGEAQFIGDRQISQWQASDKGAAFQRAGVAGEMADVAAGRATTAKEISDRRIDMKIVSDYDNASYKMGGLFKPTAEQRQDYLKARQALDGGGAGGAGGSGEPSAPSSAGGGRFGIRVVSGGGQSAPQPTGPPPAPAQIPNEAPAPQPAAELPPQPEVPIPSPEDYTSQKASKTQSGIDAWKQHNADWETLNQAGKKRQAQEIDAQVAQRETNAKRAEYESLKSKLQAVVSGKAPALSDSEYAKLYNRMQQLEKQLNANLPSQ